MQRLEHTRTLHGNSRSLTSLSGALRTWVRLTQCALIVLLVVAPSTAQEKSAKPKDQEQKPKVEKSKDAADKDKKKADEGDKKKDSKKDDKKSSDNDNKDDDKKKAEYKKDDKKDEGSTISITEKLPKIDPRLATIFGGDVPKNSGDLKAMEKRVQLLTDRLIKATVGLELQGSGSGVIISPDGLILTAAHVAIGPGLPVRVILHDGTIVKGKSLGMNRALDAGMVRIEEEGTYPFVEMGDSTNLKLGQWCLALGHPGGVMPRRSAPLRLGRVLAVEDDAIRTDCTLVGGDSGGPLFDVNGKVIGIHSRISTTLLDNLHVPAVTYKDGWTQMVKSKVIRQPGGLVKVASLGLYMANKENPRLVSRVVRNSAAAKAGIRVGDELQRIGGRRIKSIREVQRVIALSRIGQTVKISLKRDGKDVSLSVKLGSKD